MPTIFSIIIPVKNGEKTIKKCIDSLLNLDCENFDILVVDDGSKDNTLKILKDYTKKIKLITVDKVGPSRARNLAVTHADAQYIAFTDSDCTVDKNWVKELFKGFELFPDAVACGGIQKLPKDATEFEKRVFLFMKKTGFVSDYMRTAKDNSIVEVKHNPSCNVMYKKDVFLKEGGFLENLWPGEDVELDHRLIKNGHKLIFNPKAVVFHHRPKNLKSFLRMMDRYGWAQGFLVKKYGIFRRVHYVPLVSLVASIVVLVGLFLKLWGIPLLLVLSLLLLFRFDFHLALLALLGLFLWQKGFLKGFINT